VIWELGSRRLDFTRGPCLMGVLNVTPDSFYDGGRYLDPGPAVEHALRLEEEGADIVDIGGESSRPPLYGGGGEVETAEECRRVVPVITAIRRHSDVPISVDTTKAEVARQALVAGCDIVNDITALNGDVAMASVAAQAGAPVILMHMRGTPATMQKDTGYGDVVAEVADFLRQRVDVAIAAGIDPSRLALDPGLGFGKSAAGNFALLRSLDRFVDMGYPLVVGASRKSFIWKTLGLSPADSLEGSLAAAVLAVERGAHILRVHDVKETSRAVRLVTRVLDQSSRKAVGSEH
jgi:dihydropteroate synthase